MNLITLISVILLGAMAIEWLLAGLERIQRDVFVVVFCVVALLFTAKYYYGPDITTYVPLYAHIGDLGDVAAGHYPISYERGFVVFCALCHSLGMSYWWMTVVVSLLFFGAIYCLVRRLRYGQVMALALIVVMNPDLIYAQFRQCLAVSFFIFAVLMADKRQYVGALLMALVAMTMHKSAMFMIVPAMVYYTMQPRRIEMSSTGVMLLVLCLLALVPTQSVVESIVDNISGNGSVARSIRMHISFANLRQSNLLIYGTAIVALMTFAVGRRGRSGMLAMTMAGLIVIVAFYQYFYLLNRLRSYFLPFVVVAVIEMGIEARDERLPWNGLVRQTAKVVVMMFLIYKTVAFDRNSARDGDVLKMSTVFELTDNTREELMDRQMERANDFWENAFQKGDDMQYRSKNYKEQYKN